MSKTAKGAEEYLDKYVYGPKNHDDYLKLIGKEKLEECADLR
jgi:hypothetical protein